jgi:cell division protein FtsB
MLFFKKKVESKQTSNYKFGDSNAVVYSKKSFLSPKILDKISSFNLLCAFLIIFLSVNIAQSISVEYNLYKQTQKLEHEKASVMLEKQKLKKQIKFYDSPSGIEKIARESLGFIKSDEIPVRYIERK